MTSDEMDLPSRRVNAQLRVECNREWPGSAGILPAGLTQAKACGRDARAPRINAIENCSNQSARHKDESQASSLTLFLLRRDLAGLRPEQSVRWAGQQSQQSLSRVGRQDALDQP